MKRMKFDTPYDYSASGYSGWTRHHLEESFFQMIIAIMKSASPSGARQRLPGPRSHHGQLADEVEGFSRSFIMAGPWLHTSKDGVFTYQEKTYDVGAFYRKGILAGTDPEHEEYWGDLYDYSQNLVEMASVSWAMYQAREHVWDKFSEAEKQQVAHYLQQCTAVQYHPNNWLLFNVVTNTVLKKLDMDYSQEQIDVNLEVCDHMYMGDGWYRDGDVNRIDYYNAWAFLYYYLIWVILDGDSKPDLAKKHCERAKVFVRDFRYFFASDGSVPAFGRSMIYRFGYLSVVVLSQYLGILDISPGEVKTMVGLGLKFYFDQEIFTDSGHLSMGFLRPCAEILEYYSCGGSPYWAVKAYNALMISPDSPFWTACEESLPIHKGDFHKALKSAGLQLVGNKNSGHVQIINQKSRHDNPEYNAKYTKFVYSSIFSYEARKVWGNFNCDNILQFSNDGIKFNQRWEIDPLVISERFSLSAYALHGTDKHGSALTAIVLKDDFYITLHRISPTQPLQFREGGYPLGFDSGIPAIECFEQSQYASIDGKLSFIRPLWGWKKSIPAQPFNDDLQSTNVRYIRSVVPYLIYDMEYGAETSDIFLAALVVGRRSSDSVIQLHKLVESINLQGSEFTIHFYDGERVLVHLEDPRSLKPEAVLCSSTQRDENFPDVFYVAGEMC